VSSNLHGLYDPDNLLLVSTGLRTQLDGRVPAVPRWLRELYHADDMYNLFGCVPTERLWDLSMYST